VKPEVKAEPPLNGIPTANMPSSAPPLGLMGPPSRPADKNSAEKVTDVRSLEDTLSGTGVNIDEEERNLTSQSFLGSTQGSSFTARNSGLGAGSAHGSFEEYRPSSSPDLAMSGYGIQAETEQPTPEELQKQSENQLDWQAAKPRQNPLWQMFLSGDPLLNRISRSCYEYNLEEPKAGLYYATQNRPFQRTRVNGYDGAFQVIDKGETILSTQSGQVLGDIMKLLALSTKERVTGVLDCAARLSRERREHSMGHVPTEWKAVAATLPTGAGASDGNAPPSSNPLKRTYTGSVSNPHLLTTVPGTHSQINGDSADTQKLSAPNRIAEVFRKIAQKDRAAEEARLTKRSKRAAPAEPDSGRSGSISTPGGADMPGAPVPEGDRKITKKDRKIAESRFTEAQQHKAANETARLATAGILGGFGKKKKPYSWMNSGTSTPQPGASPAPQSGRAASQVASSSTPNAAPNQASSSQNSFGDWDESKDGGVQARDVLLVLETDGRAPKSLMRGYNRQDDEAAERVKQT